MRAMTLDAPATLECDPLHLRERDIPAPAAGQVLVRVHAVGVCRSNLHLIEGEWVDRHVPAMLPIVPGHEVVGHVAALGAGVSQFAPGERVGVQPLWSTCGCCARCLSGCEQLCPDKQITGESVDGGYADYVLATAAHLYRLPDDLEDASAAPLFCPGVTAYGALEKAELVPGCTVAVFGVGGVGHLVIQLARLAGAEVTAVARTRRHLELAEALGAAVILDATRTDVGAHFAARGGVDAAIVFAPSSAVATQAVAALRPRGIAVLGVDAQLDQVLRDEKRVVSTVIGTRVQMRAVLALAAAGKLHVTCETYPLEEASVALARLKANDLVARAVLVT